MKEVKVKGLLVKAPEAIAEVLATDTETEAKEEQPMLSAEEAERLLKEIKEWLDSGKPAILRKARMEKQTAVGVAPWETSAVVPSGARATNAGAVSGIVAAPNLPSWMTGNPQGAAAAAQVTAASVVESIMSALQPVLNNVIQEIGQMLGSFASAHARIFTELSSRIAEGMKETAEKQEEIVEALKDLLSEIKDVVPSGAPAEEVGMEELMPETLPPAAEEVPAPTPEEAAQPTPAEEVPAEGGAVELPEEEKEEERPAPMSPTAMMFSPQFLSALAQHLSQMTKDILETRSFKSHQQNEQLQVKPQNAFEIADAIAKSMGKKNVVEEDMTAPVKEAKAPEKGESVAAQIAGQEVGDAVKKPLSEAKRRKKGGD